MKTLGGVYRKNVLGLWYNFVILASEHNTILTNILPWQHLHPQTLSN